MDRRKLAPDVEVHPLGLGTATWTDVADATKQAHAFIEAGGSLIDTADIYLGGRCETVVGQLWDNGIARSDVVLATKAAGVRPGEANATRAHLLSSLDTSLSRLRTDHVDLWQLHVWDHKTPVEETLSALETAVSSGRVRNVGVCNYAGWQTVRAALGPVPLVTTQVEYSLLERGIEREVVPAVTELGMGVLPWAPLGRGVLTGKYRKGVPAARENSDFFRWYVGHHLRADRTALIVEAVSAAAELLETTALGVSLAWVRDRPGVVAPIVGARNVDQLLETLSVLDVVLTPEIRGRLDHVSAPYIGYPESGV
ncbi:aldo/keto reductase [Lentzea tibetensis]|uniref:Aldo/keto reductase n=1 Tax=Lentzea tibetensis TaxID=2591470 RepID=A0A563ETM4_9PSEU|nr:aldo/keto reductase [Lentzea tibetensis]TWP50851.1 aldo/keto reductase [Lentzea tibetensis]